MRATYATTCRHCKMMINVGDVIARPNGVGRWVHERCIAAPDAPIAAIKQDASKHRNFPTLGTFIAHVQALPGVSSDRRAWAGGTWDESIRLAEQGWPEGVAAATEMATRIADRVVQSIPADGPFYDYDVAGAAYDAGALMAGTPEAWSLIRETGTRREVRIVVNTSISAGISASVMMKRGIAVAALALAIQSRGYTVTVDVGGQGKMLSGEQRSVYVRVADGANGSQLDIDRIVYACAHPTFFRLLVHAYFAGDKSGHAGSHWPNDNDPPPEADLFLGGVHMHQVERWQDGGEAWIVAEYLRQTTV